MFSDKLADRQHFVETRDKLEKAYAAFVSDHAPKGNEGAFAAQLNSLMALNSELATAPVLFTLRSAAEVGFAHAQITPDAQPAPNPRKHPQSHNQNGKG